MDPYRRYITRPHPTNSRGTANEAISDSLADLGYGGNAAWVQEEIERLFAHYATKVLLGGRCRAPCPVWRSERILINDESLPRFANRVHVFQERAQCLSPDGLRHGPYLGFVSLRPKVYKRPQHYNFAYTAIAYLTAPRYMLRPRYHILTTVSGPAEGVLPFRSSPFCFPNEDTAHRASCLHSALQSALMLKASAWGCTPITGQDMVAYLWTKLEGEKSQAQLSMRGASLKDALMVLEDPDLHAGGVLESITVKDFAHGTFSGRSIDPRELVKLETHRLWTDYLANGCPIILALNLKPRAHSMLLLGMHLLRDPEDPGYDALDALCDLPPSEQTPGKVRVDLAELPGRYVAHDINDHPFAEHTAARLLEEAWFEDKRDPQLAGLHFLAITPEHTRIGIFDVRLLAKAFMMSEPKEFWVNYLRENGLADLVPPPAEEEDVRYVSRLLQTGQVIRRYFSESRAGPPREAQNLKSLLKQIGLADERFWWAVEVRLPFRVRFADWFPPALVYLWPTDADRSANPCAVIRFSKGPSRKGASSVTLHAAGAERAYEFAYRPA